MAKMDEDPEKHSASRTGSWWRRLLGDPVPESQLRKEDLHRTIDKIGLEFSTSENALEEDEKEMIHGVVELGETEVREIMIPRVEMVGIEVGTSMVELTDLIKQTGHSRFPLYKDSLDDIKGILYAKDLLVQLLDGGDIDLVKIARKAYFIPENIKADVLLRDLKKRRLHIAIVTDEYGGTSGLVTFEDVIEEIVGEIEDEYDGEPPSIAKQSPGVFIVSGSVTIADLNDGTGLELPEEEFETVGGLIYDLVGSLPEKGRAVDYHNVTFVVDQVQGQRIVKVKLIIKKKSTNDSKANF
jgi:CBS domain containing-hemolysin-like protein